MYGWRIGAPPPSFFREASNRGVHEQNSGAGAPRECFVVASAGKRSPAGNASWSAATLSASTNPDAVIITRHRQFVKLGSGEATALPQR